jgi:hypothetical protein
LTILNPDVVEAETVDVIEPSVFDTPAPFANQFQETKLSVLALTPAAVPKQNHHFQDCKLCASVISAFVPLAISSFVPPLTTSSKSMS